MLWLAMAAQNKFLFPLYLTHLSPLGSWCTAGSTTSPTSCCSCTWRCTYKGIFAHCSWEFYLEQRHHVHFFYLKHVDRKWKCLFTYENLGIKNFFLPIRFLTRQKNRWVHFIFWHKISVDCFFKKNYVYKKGIVSTIIKD